MQKWLTLLLIFCFLSCSERVSVSDLNYINGYWEIQEVKFPNGKTKKYDINMTIDYFEYDKMQGFRKKMQPKFDGTFTTSSDAESFQINEKDGSFWMLYKNDLSNWEEQIIMINKTRMVVKNKEGLSYNYRRFQTISIK